MHLPLTQCKQAKGKDSCDSSLSCSLGDGFLLFLTRPPPITWLFSSQNASCLCTNSIKGLDEEQDILYPPSLLWPSFLHHITHKAFLKNWTTKGITDQALVGGWFVSFYILIKAFLLVQKKMVSKTSKLTKSFQGFFQFLIVLFCTIHNILPSNPYSHVNFHHLSRKPHILPIAISLCSYFLNAHRIFMLE